VTRSSEWFFSPSHFPIKILQVFLSVPCMVQTTTVYSPWFNFSLRTICLRQRWDSRLLRMHLTSRRLILVQTSEDLIRGHKPRIVLTQFQASVRPGLSEKQCAHKTVRC
jgi:hypothetical protein